VAIDDEASFPPRVVGIVEAELGGRGSGDVLRALVEVQFEYVGAVWLLLRDAPAGDEAPIPRERTRGAVIDGLVRGLDPRTVTIARESDVPELSQVLWLLAPFIRADRLPDRPPATTLRDALAPALLTAGALGLQGSIVVVEEAHAAEARLAADVTRAWNDRFPSRPLPVPEIRIVRADSDAPTASVATAVADAAERAAWEARGAEVDEILSDGAAAVRVEVTETANQLRELLAV